MVKQFWAGFLLCLGLLSCAGVSIGIRYYTMQLVSYDGKLLANREENDLPVNVCRPTEYDRSPCIVMLRSDFFRLKSDFIDMKNQLDACQRIQ